MSSTRICYPRLSNTLATESEDAKRLCEQSMALYQQELKRDKPFSICDSNVRPPKYWECVVDKQKAGNPFIYSTNQCEKTDPQ